MDGGGKGIKDYVFKYINAPYFHLFGEGSAYHSVVSEKPTEDFSAYIFVTLKSISRLRDYPN